jgi:hypothetical protein
MASLKDILLKIQAQTKFESEKKGIQQKLAVTKKPTTKVKLSKMSDFISDYGTTADAINSGISELRELLNRAQLIISDLIEEYEFVAGLQGDAELIYNEAAELGVEGNLGESFNDSSYAIADPNLVSSAQSSLFALDVAIQEFDVPRLDMN